jgi:hypothetical protein
MLKGVLMLQMTACLFADDERRRLSAAAPSQELLIAARLGVGVGTVQRIGRDATSDIRHCSKTILGAARNILSRADARCRKKKH